MKNRLLKYPVYLINENPEEYKDGADGITLSVNGMLITGQLVPRKYFYEAEQNTFLNRLMVPEDEIVKDQAEGEQTTEEVDVEAEVDKITLIHLTNAFYMMGSQRAPSSGGMFIAVNIDSIDAYSIGSLNPG